MGIPTMTTPTPQEIYDSNMLGLSLSSNPAHLWAWKEIQKLTQERDAALRLTQTPNTFDEWWYRFGSGIRRQRGDDVSEHAEFVAKCAWEDSRKPPTPLDKLAKLDEEMGLT